MAKASPVFSVLDALQNGRTIPRLIATAFYVIGALVLIAGAVGVLATVGVTLEIASGNADVQAAGVLYAILFGATCVLIFEVFRYRARSVLQLSPSGFTVMPVMSIVFRLLGESYAIALLAIGLGGFMLNLFGATFLVSRGPFSNAPLLSSWASTTAAGFLGSIGLLAFAVLTALAVLLTAYFVAEVTVVAADIANNVRQFVGTNAMLAGHPSAVLPAMSPAIAAPAATVVDGSIAPGQPPPIDDVAKVRCEACSTQLDDSDSTFCLNCGARLNRTLDVWR